MRRTAKLAILGASVAAVAAAAIAPAMASVNVQLTTSSGTRTLNLYQSDGKTALTSSDLSTGTSNFIAQVTDSSYTNKGFKVQATMSNLYGFANNAYNCSAVVPASSINLSSPTGLLTVGGVNANLTPVFNIVGTLTAANTLDPALLTPVPININVNGLLPAAQNPLSQSQLTGSTATNLIGTTLANVESKLPVSLGTAGLGGNFVSPDVHPTCDTTATGPTQVPIMTSTADPTGVLGDLQSLIQTTVGSATPTVSSLISNGYLTAGALSTALQGVSALVNQITLTGLTNDLTNIISSNALTGAVGNVATLAGSLIQSGNYTSSPSLNVNTSGIPAGTYKGVMTVTLIDQ